MALDRRSFLKAVGVTGVGLVVDNNLTHAARQNGIRRKDISTIKLNGVVTGEGKGIEGAAATDGTNVTLTVSFDPMSIELHAGLDKPSKRGWVDPVLTDHTFFGKPSPSAQKIMVQVTDRFKNVYRSEALRSEFTLNRFLR